MEDRGITAPVRDVLKEKAAVLSDFVQMRVNFFVTFSRGAFLVNEGVHFFQNVNNLNFKLFFRSYTFMYIVYYIYTT